MSEYRIYLDDELICKTDWPPMAQAAWHRAARERNAAQNGCRAVFFKDGQCLADVQPRTQIGHPWPDQSAECDLRDIVKASLTLLRHAGVDVIDVADAMTKSGIPTTRSHIDAMRGSTPGKRAEVSVADVVCLLYAAIPLLQK